MITDKTFITKKNDVVRKWHLVDAKDQVLGRLASRISPLLMGKNKAYFDRRADCGDYVVVINAKQIRLTGKKVERKTYQHYSGYSGGRKEVAFAKMLTEQPEKIIRNAVVGMLPKNKLQDKMIVRLHVFAGKDHKFSEKFTNNKQVPLKQETA